MIAMCPAALARPMIRAYRSAAPSRSSSSYTSASSAPEPSAPRAPHRTKPRAKAQYDGVRIHSAKPAAVSSGPSRSSSRRETASAQAPEGTSSTTPVIDQMANREEICQTDRPVSLNSRAYTG